MTSFPNPSEQKPAGFWIRGLATFVDALILLIPIIGIRVAIAPLGLPAFYEWCVSDLAFPALYTLGFWKAKSATPGKLLFGLRLVEVNGGELSWGKLAGRYAGYYLSLLPLGLGYFWAGWDPRKQTFHDKLAGTLVVYEEGRKPWPWFKILGVGFLFFVLLMVLAGGAGYWIWQNNKDAIKIGLETKVNEITLDAREAAGGRNQKEILDEAFRRHDACETFLCMAGNLVFLKEALPNAEPSEGFCDGVPGPTDIMGSVRFRVSRCVGANRDDEFCGQLMKQVQDFCQEKPS